jgi:hypothetical protein
MTLSGTIVANLNKIIKTVHNSDSDDDFLLSMPEFRKAVAQNNGTQVNRIVSLWVEQRLSGIKNVIKTKSMMQILQSLGTDVVPFDDKNFNLCPHKNFLSNLTSCHIHGAMKTQVLVQILLWSFISRRANLFILHLINKELQNDSETSTEIRLKQGENSLDHLWSWLLSFTKSVSLSVIATFAKVMSSKQLPTDTTSFHCFFMEDAILLSMVSFSWLGMSPVDSVDKLDPLERLVPDSPQGNFLRQNKVLLFTASFVSSVVQFISPKNEEPVTTEAEMSQILHEISSWQSLTYQQRLSQFTSTQMFLNCIPTMEPFCLHEAILKELTSKVDEESIISPQHPTQPNPLATGNQPQPRGEVMDVLDNFLTEHSEMKTIVKNFFKEMSFLKNNGVSVVSVSEFVGQLKYPPESNNPTIALVYLLTERLLAQEREQIMADPLLPAYEILLRALKQLEDSRNTTLKRNKWSFVCEIFNPQEEAKNQLLQIFLTKCLDGQLPVIHNTGLFECLTKRYFTSTAGDSEGRSKTAAARHAATPLKKERTPASSTSGGRSKTAATRHAATPLKKERTPASSAGGGSKTVVGPSNTTDVKSKGKNSIKNKPTHCQVSSPCTRGGLEQGVLPRKTVEKRKILTKNEKDVKISRKV